MQGPSALSVSLQCALPCLQTPDEGMEARAAFLCPAARQFLAGSTRRCRRKRCRRTALRQIPTKPKRLVRYDHVLARTARMSVRGNHAIAVRSTANCQGTTIKAARASILRVTILAAFSAVIRNGRGSSTERL